jgi:5-methylcytosine-specific restriction endonuclease McrA
MRAMGRHPSTWAGRAVINARRGFVAAAELGQAFTCPFCGDPVDVAGDPAGWHVDHGTPRAYGGGHDPANLRPAHALCNMRAGQRLSTRKALRPW